MKISRKKFVLIFVLSAFVFQFVSNALLGPEVRLFPADGQWFPGTGSSIGWKSTVAAIIYPVKNVLVGPLSFLGEDRDAPPPILLVAFALYWTIIAVVLHFLIGKLIIRKAV